MERIYLDYAATTPVDREVLAVMEPYFSEKFGNPGSLHSFGQEAMAAVDESREAIAKAINANFSEIVFTGSATESNNLALRGTLKGFRVQGLGSSSAEKTLSLSGHTLTPRIIVSAVEHESVLETARDLERDGVEVIYLPVDKHGVVDLEALKSALNERTVLVSVMYANNEVGTIQPISAIAEIVREFRIKNLEFRKKTSLILNPEFYPLFHVDAAQAFQFLDCNVNKLGIDLMTLSAHKIYGPKGIGALYVRANKVQGLGSSVGKNLNPSGHTLKPIITGGGQEFGLRSGTENVPLIVGFAKAVELVAHSRELENKRIAELRDDFWQGLRRICPNAELNGAPLSDANGLQIHTNDTNSSRHSHELALSSRRLPSILNVYFPGQHAEELLTKFDLAGLAVSSGPACRSRAVESSHVIEALGYPKERAKSSIRFSFGRPTKKPEAAKALGVIKSCL